MESKILYIHPGLSTFVKKDIAILQKQFDVKVHLFDVSRRSKVPLSFFKLLIEILFRHSKRTSVVVQFAGFHSFLPVFFGRLFSFKTYIVLGGTDCASFPSISYGSFNHKLLKPFVAYSIKHAYRLLPVSDTLVHYKYTYNTLDFPYQGYLAFLPKVKTPYTTIYNGYDSKNWFIGSKLKRTFVTIGANLGSRYAKQLKGIDLILEVAPHFPSCTFNIIGGKSMNSIVPDNVQLIENMTSEELADFISTQEFYMQLSMSEGFPNALCEAMMSGCIPIVSDVGAMPLIVGEFGYVLRFKSTSKLIEIIQSAISEDQSRNTSLVRKQIEDNFPLSLREEKLNSILMH